MAQVDVKERQVVLKLVYYGPPLSGKTSNLESLHGQVDERGRGRLMSLDTTNDRTLFFDLLPLFFRSSKLSVRVKVYTVPGQSMHEATRRVVLTGADGVVFVADSRRAEAESNRASYSELLSNLARVGLDASAVPITVQYNKRDLDDVLGEDELVPLDDSRGEQPVFSAIASTGVGVLDTFYGEVAAMWRALDRRAGVGRLLGVDEREFMAALRQHLQGGGSEIG